MPQAMLTTASTWGATSTSSSTNSHSHCRSSVLVRTLIVRPSFLSAICNRGARVSTSRSPPAAHSATQVAHPTTSTLVCPFSFSTSSGRGFHSAIIIFHPPSWDWVPVVSMAQDGAEPGPEDLFLQDFLPAPASGARHPSWPYLT